MNSKDIARLAKVSRSTVSKVLNGYSNISPKTRKRVEDIIQQVGYEPDESARSLVGKTNKNIALFIIDIHDENDDYTICRSPFYSNYIAYGIDIAGSAGYNLLISVIRKKNLSDIEKLFNNKTVSSGILMGDYLDISIVERLLGKGHRIALYNYIEKSFHNNLIVVNYDNFKCGKMAAEELIKRGHKKIAHITGDLEKLGAQGRMNGMLAAMKNAGLEFDRENYLATGAFHREAGGYSAAKRLLKNNMSNLPTAIFAANSIMMLGALQAIKDVGLRVPEDISLIGIEGLTLAEYTTPPLTEIVTSQKKVAMATILRLVELLENGSLETNDYEVSDATLVIRDSILNLD